MSLMDTSILGTAQRINMTSLAAYVPMTDAKPDPSYRYYM